MVHSVTANANCGSKSGEPGSYGPMAIAPNALPQPDGSDMTFPEIRLKCRDSPRVGGRQGEPSQVSGQDRFPSQGLLPSHVAPCGETPQKPRVLEFSASFETLSIMSMSECRMANARWLSSSSPLHRPTSGPAGDRRASVACFDMFAPPQDNKIERLVLRIVEAVQPSPRAVRDGIAELRATSPGGSDRAVAELWANRVCRRYAAGGALSAVPAVIPGLGTSAQLAIEGGTIAADIAYMLRCMADIVLGVSEAFGRILEPEFDEEFVRVLAIWCGASTISKKAAIRLGTKLAVAQAKHLPIEAVKRLRRRIARDILEHMGIRRGGVTIGRLLPLGVGVLVGGGFNYATMRSFKHTAIGYYGPSWENEFAGSESCEVEC